MWYKSITELNLCILDKWKHIMKINICVQMILETSGLLLTIKTYETPNVSNGLYMHPVYKNIKT